MGKSRGSKWRSGKGTKEEERDKSQASTPRFGKVKSRYERMMCS